MSESLLPSRLERFDAGHYQPVTFIQRGISLPFTTPSLLGARIRPSDNPRMPELLLSSAAGQEGVYIVPWAALPDICTPTLHDRALWARTMELSPLAPRTVRAVARSVAAEGFAGRPAAVSAQAAVASDIEARTRAHYHLLLELVRQGETQGVAGPPPERESLDRLQMRARAVLKALEAGQGLSPKAAYEALAEVAEACMLCGLPKDPTVAALPALATEISMLVRDLSQWAEVNAGPERVCIRLIGESAEMTLRCFRAALSKAHARLADLPAVLRRWMHDRQDVLTLVARPEWLLDGWSLLCSLWRNAEPAQRSLALLDMAGLVPMIPTEVNEWFGSDAADEVNERRGDLRRWRRTVQSREDWMTGRILALVARNESLRSLHA